MNWDRNLWDFGLNNTRDCDINGASSNLYHPGHEVMTHGPFGSKNNILSKLCAIIWLKRINKP